MGKQIDLSGCNDPAPVIKLNISDVEIELRVCFSLSCCKLMFRNHDEEGKDYRTSFAGAVFSMYQQKEGETVLTEDDFINTTDENLQLVLDCILEQDQRGKARFEESKIEDVYERFYKAIKDVLHFSIKSPSIHKQIIPQKKALSLYPSPAFQRALKAQRAVPKWLTKVPNLRTSSTLQAIQKQQQFLKNSHYPHLASLLSSIPKSAIDANQMIAPFYELEKTVRMQNEGLAHILRSPLKQMGEQINKLINSVAVSSLIRNQKWSEARETLLEYGWIYSGELPISLANTIHEQREYLKKEDVDIIITNFFRENRCEELKRIVKSCQMAQIPLRNKKRKKNKHKTIFFKYM